MQLNEFRKGAAVESPSAAPTASQEASTLENSSFTANGSRAEMFKSMTIYATAVAPTGVVRVEPPSERRVDDALQSFTAYAAAGVSTKHPEPTLVSDSAAERAQTKQPDEQAHRPGLTATQLEERERMLTERSVQLEERERTFTERSTQLEEGERTLTERSVQLEERERTLTERSVQLEERERTLTERVSQLEEQEHVFTERLEAQAAAEQVLREVVDKLSKTVSEIRNANAADQPKPDSAEKADPQVSSKTDSAATKDEERERSETLVAAIRDALLILGGQRPSSATEGMKKKTESPEQKADNVADLGSNKAERTASNPVVSGRKVEEELPKSSSRVDPNLLDQGEKVKVAESENLSNG